MATTTTASAGTSTLDVFIDATSLNQKETRAIKITQKQLEDKLLNGLIVAEFGSKMDANWLGRTVILIGEHDAKYHADRDARTALIRDHSHGSIMQRIITLGETKVHVRSGDHLEELCGIKKRAKGGDFRHDDPAMDRTGDLKFYEMGKDICLAGSVDLEAIKEQGETLVIARHPRDEANRIVLGQLVQLWQIPGALERVTELVEAYHEWNRTGREGAFKSSNEIARIALHRNSPDRLHIRNSFIRKHAVEFYRDLMFREKRGIEAWVEHIDQRSEGFEMTSPKTPVPVTTIKLKTIISHLKDGTFAIPFYQRGIETGKKFLRAYIADTVLTGNQEHRGIFMFHTPVKNGKKIYIVDGQQRIMNALRGFFVDGNVPLEDCEIVFQNTPLNISNRTWTEIEAMAKVNARIKKFVADVLERPFSVRNYDHTYDGRDMSLEYRIANSIETMNRQQLRASFGSPLGNVVRYFTGTTEFRLKVENDADMAPIAKEIKDGITLHDETILKLNKAQAALLHFGGIKTAKMELDKFISICYHRCTAWKKGYTEDEDILDDIYHDAEKKTTKAILAEWNEKLEPFFDLLESAYTYFLNNPNRFTDIRASHHSIGKNIRGNRIFARKEEIDLLSFLILELQRRHKGKTLTITGDVASWVFKQHVPESVEPRKNGDGTCETTYGGEIRRGTRSWDNIQKMWFEETWNKRLLDLPVGELAKIGFTIN